MTILKKNMVTTVILGTKGQDAVEGHPYIPAYWTLESYTVFKWVLGPGITMVKIPYDASMGLWIYGPDGSPIWIGSSTDGVIGGVQYTWEARYLGGLVPEGMTIATYIEVVEYESVYHEAIPAVASVPGIAATPNQIGYSANVGWNSYAISIDSLDMGSYIELTLAPGITGAFIGVGLHTLHGFPIGVFPHGILADPGGIKVFESDTTITTLSGAVTPTTVLRIYRSSANVITYTAVTGDVTSVYESLAIPFIDYLYVHSYLYSGLDTILSAEFGVGVVGAAQATLAGEGTLTVQNASVVLSGTGTLTVAQATQATLTGIGTLTALRGNQINVTLPPLQGILADKNYGRIDADLPALTGEMVNEYVPLAAQTIYGNVPPLTFTALLLKSHAGEIAASLPALVIKGGMGDSTEDPFNYGEITGDLAALQINMFDDPEPLVGECRNLIYTAGNSYGTQSHLESYSESATLTDTLTLAKILYALLDESYAAVDTYSALESMVFSFDSIILGGGNSTVMSGAAVGAGLITPEGDSYTVAQSNTDGEYPIALEEANRVWVVNLETGASAQYDDYGFNSFFDRDGKYYGVADDGIYLLEGNDDAGSDIDALMELGRSNLETSFRKTIPNVYAGLSSEGKMYLMVDADEQKYYYEARGSSTAFKNQRFDIGRGLTGNYYTLTLLNQNGDDFGLETITFSPVISSRKI